MRLFIAINFPEEAKKDIQKVVVPLVTSFPQVSWVKLENIHLTLKFLGNTKENQLVNVKKAIRESIEGIKPFKLSFDRLGYFDKNQLIIWLGIKPSKKLLSLVDKTEKETFKLGFPRERKAFSPHVTLGRGKRLSKMIVRRLKEEIRNYQHQQSRFPSINVSEVSLMQSNLTRQGSIYTIVERFALG